MRRSLLALALLAITLSATAKEALPFIENDYRAALAKAKKENVPVFVEAWAPWCHTCRSMKAFVFTDQALGKYAGRFVWLAIDTEDAKNATFLTKYPIPALPTMLVLDPRSESVALRYVGGATVPQLSKILDDGERAYRGKTANSADALLASAEKLAGAGKDDEAAKLYGQAIEKAPKSWKSFNRAAESYVLTLSLADKTSECADAARDLYPKVKGTSSGANVAATGLDCSLNLDEKDPKRAELVSMLEKSAREAFDDPKVAAAMSGDDRSGMYMTLIAAREDAKDETAAKQLTQEWSTFLDGEAARAATPEQRAVYDPHRLSAYLELGTPEKAIPMLEQTERENPDDYNPAARLALAYKAMKKYDEAIAASDRALKHVYGPRKITVLRARADIFAAKGDTAAAKQTIADAVAYAKSLPAGQRSDRTIASLEKKLATM
ncbi:MAG: thioredoxin family protein [Acidobacteria bacterium]|nr:thioredoxin family protein [Acidobacteriota bacterium]